jgi:hypothetical protein
MDVNPLTRPASRSVMRLNYFVAAVEGPAATIVSLPGRNLGNRPFGSAVVNRWVGPLAHAMIGNCPRTIL